MKKIFWILILFFLPLFSENNVTFESFMIYKTMDNTLTLEDIKTKKKFFKALTRQSQLEDRDATYWLKIEFNSNISSGKYLASYSGYDFDFSSFSKNQQLTKYVSNQKSVFSFEYDKDIDSKEYYFKLINSMKYVKPSLEIENFSVYYKDAFLKPDSPYFFLLFGIIMGIIFMVTIYNFSVFYYTRDISFLYYSLMELLMLVMLVYQIGIVSLDILLFNASSLISGFFATLFMRSFLETKTYLPKLDKTLQLYLLLILFDLVFLAINHYSLVMNFALYSIFGVIYFIVGFLRLKEGFTPAKFFLLGWSMLVISIFYTERVGNLFGMSPLLFGSPLEAIFLAIGLAYKLKLELNEKKQQQELLVHQSKLASMGEMIGNIAHQWKQPLTYLSYNFMNLRAVSKRNLLNDEYLNKKLDKADAQLLFMSQTIENFKDFYLPNKQKEKFSIEQASLETLEIVSYEFEQKKIEVIFDVKEDIVLESYKNEYKQVLLNLLTNAKDVFLQREVISPKITITINKNYISVLDNAGGIPKEILHRIYEPYFTTKKGNSGIGLYMSKMIVEKDMEGKLTVENSLDGALFNIYF